MMVRSAVKDVSKTRSKPMCRNAAVITAATSRPAFIPNSSASVTEILFSLEVDDKIVGRDCGSNYPTECKNIEVLSTYEGIDIEKILYIDPDIIIMDKTLDLSDTNYNKMIDYDLCVFRVYPKSLQDVLDDIILLGKVTGTESKAQEQRRRRSRDRLIRRTG